MATKQEHQREMLETLLSLKDRLTDPKSLLKVTTEYGRGVTDYLTVELFYLGHDGTIQNWDITGVVAVACNYSRRTKGGWQIAMGGGGFTKSHSLVSTIARAIGVELDAIRWDS